MFGKNEKERREVASITKIMTFYVVLQLQERFKKKDETLVEVSDEAASIHGTSADLLAGDTLTIWQLCYGLMLPSGNDAGFALAEYFGALLRKDAEIEEKRRKEEERLYDETLLNKLENKGGGEESQNE